MLLLLARVLRISNGEYCFFIAVREGFKDFAQMLVLFARVLRIVLRCCCQARGF